MNTITRSASILALGAMLLASTSIFADSHGPHESSGFQGPKANTGTVVHTYEGGKSILRVSQDFKVPDTPAPTWRIIDSKGVVYTLDAFKTKGGEKRTVVVPPYVHNIAKVQVYCAWAEVLLGEAGYSNPVK